MNSIDESILLKIYEEVKETRIQVQKIPEIEKEVKKIAGMEKEISTIKDEILQINTKLEEIPKMQNEIKDIKEQLKDIPEIKQELRNISGSVARIEIEHGEKLVALFDAFKVNTEKIEEQNERIKKCENMLEKHDNQIYILNSKIKNI